MTNAATVSDLNGSSKLLVPGRATAATNIPQGATSAPIQPQFLIGNPDVVQIMVGINGSKMLDLNDSSEHVWSKDVHWVRAIRISEDCHSYNVQLRLKRSTKGENPSLTLQAVRSIAIGEELLLWFSEEILTLLQMVFLTPANIQGQKRYICTRCSALYESPNPLKLHLALGCERQSICDLWKKLANLVTQSDSINPPPKSFSAFSFKLTTNPKQKSAMDLSRTVSPTDIKRPTSHPSKLSDCTNSLSTEDDKILYRPYSEPPTTHTSAFKPFHKMTFNDSLNTPYSIWPNFTFNPSYHSPDAILINNAQSDESQMETLVSSLGKSKEGHICLYCGKCYSRKYGLKIHIRTHTGYKPLKCKFCMRPFGDPSNLNKHVRLHAEGDTPYKCDLCGKILVRRRDLERHLKSRHMSEIHPGRGIPEERLISESETDVEDVNVDR
ncbi:zinc finger protein 761 [Photinus pyralis]|nr:zinc finger protein 761 [Photinus pyralis]